jgi:alkylation response protein AidB-like acyl-CoA dehydrogenase
LPGFCFLPVRARQYQLPTRDDRARYRRDQAYIARLSVQATNRLFDGSGGRGLFDSNALQRFHRDIHAALHHFSLAWDVVA